MTNQNIKNKRMKMGERSETYKPIGLEWLFQCTKASFKRKNDVFALYVHYKIIASGFKCMGLGDASTVHCNNTPTELLPDHWNDCSDVYTLRYTFNNLGHLLKIVTIEDKVIINFLRHEGEVTTSIDVVVNDFIRDSYQTYLTAYTDRLGELSQRLDDTVLAVMLPPKPRPPEHSQTGNQQQHVPTREPDPGLPWMPRNLEPEFPEVAPFGVGDLDPLGRLGGGLLMEPRGRARGGHFTPGAGLPRGAVPPGARFDPFSPMAGPRGGPRFPRGGGFGPDNDHLPPPGADDMFM